MNTMGLKRLATIALLLCGVFGINQGVAQGVLLLDDYPDSYVVQEGDTIDDIAAQFLRDPSRWADIWRPDDYLDDSELIFPGDTLRVSFVRGAPRVLVQRGARQTVRLSPQVREETLSSAIPAIPLEAIENSFTRNRIITRDGYDAAPYIVQNVGNNLAIGTGDEVYARGNWPTGTSSFEVYREGRQLRAENDESTAVIEAEYLGFATIAETSDDGINKLLINASAKEIRVGDRLLIREQSSIGATIFPTEPASDVSGEIVAFLDAQNYASQLDTVVVDLGLADNLAVGDILSIRKDGAEVVDEIEASKMSFGERFRHLFNPKTTEMPDQEIGTLLVYKTFEDMSYAVILSSSEPAQLMNRVTSP